MVNTSLEYRKALYEDKRSFIPKVNILLSNGTVLELSGNQIMQGGVKIDDGVSSPGSFDTGSAVIGKLTLNINNMQDEYSTYDFTDAVATVFVGLQLADRVEWLKKAYSTQMIQHPHKVLSPWNAWIIWLNSISSMTES